MNNLFAGFDLAIEPSQTIATKPSAKSGKMVSIKNMPTLTNQNLYAGTELEEFNIELNKPKPETLAKKVNKPEKKEIDSTKILKSKKVSLTEKLALIKIKVLEVLGRQKKNVLVIKDKKTFEDYVSKAIEFGRIAIDTETNNSLDPITCKLMGLCLYTKGEKQVYIPLNHRDPETKERFSWQLTEGDCREQLQRIVDAGTCVVMHNGKFDYEVIKCTCDIAVPPTWDTMVAARLLDENDQAGLKYLYITKIDRQQEKYDIEKLFENVAYADVEPEIFALYAARDAGMTDELYEVQVVEFEDPSYGPHLDLSGKHEVKGLRWVFENIEMPIVVVTAEMELAGVKIDTAFGERLKKKYTQQLEAVDAQINQVLVDIQPIIKSWKLTTEANARTRTYVPKKTKMSQAKIEERYPYTDEKGLRYKIGKAKVEQLSDPINLASPTQLAILFYDILNAPTVSKKSPRGTGKDELKALNDKLSSYLPKKKLDLTELELTEEDLEVDEESLNITQLKTETSAVTKYKNAAILCDLILKRRGIVKLVTTYIDVIPDLVKHWPDGRIRFHLNSLGTDTGRYSSGGKLKFMENEEAVVVSGINIQNIPSHNPEVRMLFTADTKEHVVECIDNCYVVPETDEVETDKGWVHVDKLVPGDIILGNETQDTVIKIDKQNSNYLLFV